MASKKKENKGYSVETLKKYIAAIRILIAFYINLYRETKQIKLAISTGNRKIGRVLNVSIAPIVTCGNCGGCCWYCYDIKACLQYGNVMHARARNTALLQENRQEYFEQIKRVLSKKRKRKYFRWHVAGEIPDIDYLQNMIDIARQFPEWTFWTYTKMYCIVNAWIAANGGTKESIPTNLHIMFSEWEGMPIINPYNLPEFRVHMPGKPIPKGFKCPGNCEKCIAENTGCVAGMTTYNDLH